MAGAALCVAPSARAATTKSHSTISSKRHSSRPLSTAKSAPGKGTQAKRHTSAIAHPSSKSGTHAVASRGWSSRHSRRPAHKPPPWTRQHLEPDRVTEIQRALGQAGYFHGQPNGQWDEQTREAMRRYQADNRFGATGLPDARSLMKLGLGPHALPEDVGRSAPAAAVLAAPLGSGSSSQPPPQQ